MFTTLVVFAVFNFIFGLAFQLFWNLSFPALWAAVPYLTYWQSYGILYLLAITILMFKSLQ